MIFYLSSPSNQMHASFLADAPVLLSYTLYPKSGRGGKCPMMDDYIASFGRILIDCGAWSAMNSGVVIDGEKYAEWLKRWEGVEHVDAVAGLDVIGDWRASLKNYERYGGFPTLHLNAPDGVLNDLIPLARERGHWIGLGGLAAHPAGSQWEWVRKTLDRIPDDLHVHIWGGGSYSGHPDCDSVDSTNWFRDAWKYLNQLPFLTPAECVELVVKRYRRTDRVVKGAATTDKATAVTPCSLFDD